MSSATYREPHQLSAGMLALAVHGAFFLLLYFGFNWQAVPPKAMSVELWQSLPDAVPVPVAAPAVAEPVQQVQPEAVVKPEIALPKPKPEKKQSSSKPPVAKRVTGTEKRRAEESAEARSIDQQAAREQEEFERAEREQADAIGKVVDEYKARIMTKIQRGLVMPPGVNKDARAEVLVTLLPGGRVLKVELKKSSGNAAYDNAVQRSIDKASPLPLPPDVDLFDRFRELKLVFRPVD